MRSSREPLKDEKARPDERRNPHSLAVISDGAVLNGFFRSTASIRLDGSFKGTIIADHELIIAPQGRVEARVKARRAVIAGLFQGEMVVLEELEIAPTGRFIGKLIQKEPVLRISRGGRFEAESIYVDDLEAIISPWGVPPPPPPLPQRKGDADRPAAPEEIKL
jgi:cytoskeletal protein CcmA (bactofilin family)